MAYDKAFSEFEILNTSLKFNAEEGGEFTKLGCIGSAEEELNVMVVTKRCEGQIVKSVSRGATDGTLNLTLHIKYDLYAKAFGMDVEGLKEGVYAYGKNSRHREFCLVAEVFDEDGNKKLIAYPKCVMASAPQGTIENGAEEVAEIEMEINLMADDNGNVKYEAIVSEVTDETLVEQWMTAFAPELVKEAE